MLSIKDLVPITSEYALSLATNKDSVLIQIGGSQVRAPVVKKYDQISLLNLPVEISPTKLKHPVEGSATVLDLPIRIKDQKIISKKDISNKFVFQDMLVLNHMCWVSDTFYIKSLIPFLTAFLVTGCEENEPQLDIMTATEKNIEQDDLTSEAEPTSEIPLFTDNWRSLNEFNKLVIPPPGSGDTPKSLEVIEKLTSIMESGPTRTTESGLIIADKVVGMGDEASAGQMVSVNYTGSFIDGTQFDTSVGRYPFSFPLGEGEVIKGWDEGVAGMKVGGKRILIIPPELGYGDQGAGEVIPPNAILIFEIELLEIN